ncbi:amidohydrolase [Rubrivivax benzoatilyticus JA2 = ATCC BAA-35]|nr:amidohydrolase [Rubrivivax benzoatilyticus JA2 = ATCC BAA-35]
MKLIDSIVADAAGIATLRRDLHAHPELCFEEQRTSDLIAAALEGWGIPVHRGLGKTGVVGIVKKRQLGARRRPACRHRRAADHREEHLRARQPPRRPHARLRPRRPHGDAAGGRPAPGDEPELRRHRVPGVPAGRRRRRRRARDDPGRLVRAFPDGGDLRRPQLAGAGSRPVRGEDRPGLRQQQRVQGDDPRQGRARGDAAQRHRPSARRLPAGQRLARHRHAQQAPDRHRGDLDDDDPRRRGDQRHPRQRRAAGHGAHLHDRGAGPGGAPHAAGGRSDLRGLRRTLRVRVPPQLPADDQPPGRDRVRAPHAGRGGGRGQRARVRADDGRRGLQLLPAAAARLLLRHRQRRRHAPRSRPRPGAVHAAQPELRLQRRADPDRRLGLGAAGRSLAGAAAALRPRQRMS